MTGKPGFSSLAVPAMARAQKQNRRKNTAMRTWRPTRSKLERRALEAIEQGLPALPQAKKPVA
jgi:hypothetical protein